MDREKGALASRPCFQFQRGGSCKFGARCKFSHDTSSSSAAQSRPPTRHRDRDEQQNQPQDRLREWKRLLNPSPSNSWAARAPIARNQRIGDRFFQLALELMEGDVGASQETVRLMAQDDGLAFIKDLVDRYTREAIGNPAEDKARLWLGQIRPMFQLLTHTRVADSNVLEQQVATICNFIQGIGGRRMRTLFDFIVDLLHVWSTLPMAQEDEYGISACELSLSVLATMIDCNTSNIVDDNYNQIVKQFEDHVEGARRSPDDFSKLQARKHLQYLWRRLGVGDALKTEAEKKVPVTRAEFVMRKDLPGVLSPEGPRHDNDHANICNIRILPTHEEITSKRNEYLPTTDSSLFHTPGITGRLDREFRLLREDTVGQLRDAVGIQLDAMRNGGRKNDRANRSTLRTYAYEDATVIDIDFDRNNGMDMVIRFGQPATKKKVQQRRDWWGISRRLQPGGLVCIVSEDGSVLFCVVGDNTIIAHEQKKENTAQDEAERTPKRPSLADDDVFAYVHLRLAEVRQNDIRQVLEWFQSVGPMQHRCLVEFPGVLLPSFQHTLMALQQMSKKSDVPFDDLLASREQTLTLGVNEVEPPRYTTRPGFFFNLGCLATDNTTLHHSPQNPLDPEVLSRHSTLDLTQSSALLHTLSRKLALIQGPPGTGKSYTGEKLIKALLANKTKAKLGPILCVCYTNHALDQLLVHLLREKVKIIRMGSRSKAEELENVNLRIVAQSANRTKAEKSSLWEQRQILDDLVSSITGSIQSLASCHTLGSLRKYLRDSYPQHHKAFFGGQDENGWEEVHRDPGQLLKQWKHSGLRVNSHPRNIDVLRWSDLWSMTHSERSLLYEFWIRDQRDPLITQIMQKYEKYQAAKVEREKVSRDVDLRCLHDAEVVGVTTTGLARNLDLLQKLRCKVMLCEEAGEVLEAHTLTALLPSVEHAILIGDHLQLRPQIANYDLQSTNPGGAQYSLDVSLFERLINPLHYTDPRLPFETLETQRRMHPSVSELIRSTLYPSLDDGGAVSEYPEVSGMKKRLFWLHHESPEDQESQVDPMTTSRTNTFEVEMTVSLVQHLVRQGSYGPDDIAVITPYLGQLMQLRRAMGNLFEISVGERDLDEIEAIEAEKLTDEGVAAPPYKPPTIKRTLLKSIRLATVDNFQGEEAKVVVISLVRSNDANRCGFLSTSNRINVLLSRAQHGMYLIGNANTYRNVTMWAKVLGILEKNGNVGKELELQCPRHPNTPLLVSKADDFLRVAPEGGCILPCDRRLSCGHSCVNRCHHENLHNAVKCLEPCPRPKRGCQHPCKRVCGDPCGPRCNEYLRNLNIILACGHIMSEAYCWQTQDPSNILCKQMMKKTVPGCGHTVEVFCHTDVNADSYRCGKMCGDPLPCGHNCRSSCYQCKERKDGEITKVNHGICKQTCDRHYTTCQHSCTQPCHPGSECPLCPAPCEVRCSHSKCSKKCHEPCPPCAEQACASSCPHAQCTMPCAAPCDWVPCSKRCEKFLDCGHQCPSICGETCPSTKFCQTCCSDDIKAVEVDFIFMAQYHEIDLDDDPCIFPDCGHFTTKSSMDGIMDMKAHYEMSAEGNPTALINSTQPFSMDEVKTCPTCRRSLRSIARYGRIVRRAMLDEATKKFISWSTIEYSRRANELLDVQERISKSTIPRALPQNTQPSKKKFVQGRVKPLQLIRDWEGSNRYVEILKFWHGLNAFINQVKQEEQPFHRVGDFVQHAARQRKLEGDFAFDETRIQHKGYLQACSLLLRCETLIVSDFMEVRKVLANARPKLTLDFSLQIKDCKTVAGLSKATKHPRQEAEAYVYLAKFYAFSRALIAPAEDESSEKMHEAKVEELKKQALDCLTTATELTRQYSGQTQGLSAEIEATKTTVNDGVFYNSVSAEEMRAVYAAMAREFSGTGHWYTCENGHPFTVGECGMPMQMARCPECDAPVGGTDHTPAQGVQRADAIEDISRGMGRMGIH